MTGVVAEEVENIVQFRAIPYATLPGRFKHSVLRENFNGLSRNFTKQGFAFPHTFTTDDIHSGGPYPGAEPIQTSEFESLILQINVPLSHLKSINTRFSSQTSLKKLPVMTYIHGGGFVLGKIDAHHSTAYMVQHSITTAQPIIAINIQYRLGALGFMATPDGGKNFALYDQRNALLWIQKFIDGFGGDPSRMTAFGESAGGYSICYHMLSRPPPSGPLFNRAIIMSGVIGPVMMPISQQDADKVYDKILERLDVKEAGNAVLEKLRSLDVQKLVDASDYWTSKGNFWSPVDDSTFFRERPITWDSIGELLAKCDWIDDIIVGNTGFEGAVLLSFANTMTPQSLHNHIAEQLSAKAAEKVMEAYNLTLDTDQNLFLTAAMRWGGDITFDVPIDAFSRCIAGHSNKRIYRYIFDVRNPFPNAPFYQQAHHWVDVYFVFRTMQFRFSHQFLKQISDKHAGFWIAFANGKAPWSAYKDEQKLVMVADERDGWIERTQQQHEELSGINFGRLKKLWDIWGEKKGEVFLPLNLATLHGSDAV
ncbi:Alpha/Beta hydrolase protein [Pyrenochaeta sp. MPI-SDFR-AT-0127]|nr:Alpha/Beta hydrolase protein [Pyrenochaeta sp. MPI-SDFR-AT-0127]